MARTRCARLSLLILTCLSGARAQTSSDNLGLARSLFNEGRALAAQGKYAQACPKFEESQRIDPGTGTLFNLADCLEHTGRLTSAWARFLDVAAAARMANQLDREKVARARAAALEPKLAKIVLEVKAPAVGIEVRRDDLLVGQATWGSPMPVDPGKHLLEAHAPGKQPWKTTLDVPATASILTVTIPELAPGASASGGALLASDNPASDKKGTGAHTTGFILLGVGVAGTVVGTILGLKALSKNDELSKICPRSIDCSSAEVSSYQSTHDAAVNARTISTIGFAVGGAALAAGALLFVVTPSTKGSGSKPFELRATTAPGYTELLAAGTF